MDSVAECLSGLVQALGASFAEALSHIFDEIAVYMVSCIL